ncbi:MAG: TerC family protein [Pseudomonadota bacterium]|nr:TerC family protein [Pseudomonadota bacterium]
MEFLSLPWLWALFAIVVIDLILAGDNAIVIALAARRLPAPLRTRAIVWGTVGAVAVRALMTLGVVWLLRIPGLMLAGGVGLAWIAYRLLVPDPGEDADRPHATSFFGALKTIVIADALMGVDNVLGVAGAAKGNMTLVAIGLVISVPIMAWGSTMVLRLVDRFPLVIYLGAAVLAYTAAHLVVSEPWLARVFGASLPLRFATYLVLITGVLVAGRRARARPGPAPR